MTIRNALIKLITVEREGHFEGTSLVGYIYCLL